MGGGPDFTLDEIRPLVEELDRACEEVGRDPASLQRSYDLYLPITEGADDLPPAAQTAEAILSLGELGITEARCYLHPLVPATHDAERRAGLVEEMADLVQLVHAG